MSSVAVFGEPSEVIVEEGEVIVEGPDGVAVTLTEETARRLAEAAAEARRQKRG